MDRSRYVTEEDAPAKGLTIFCLGIAKKVLIADKLAVFVASAVISDFARRLTGTSKVHLGERFCLDFCTIRATNVVNSRLGGGQC